MRKKRTKSTQRTRRKMFRYNSRYQIVLFAFSTYIKANLIVLSPSAICKAA